MAEAAACACRTVSPRTISRCYKSQYRLALNLEVKVQKGKRTPSQIRGRLARGLGRRCASRSCARDAGARSAASMHFSSSIAPPGATCGGRMSSDRRRCAGADRGALGSLLSARDLHRRHSLAHGRLRADAGLYGARVLGQRHLDLSRPAAAASRARQIAGDVPRPHAARSTGARRGARTQGRNVSLGGRPRKRQRADAAFRPCARRARNPRQRRHRNRSMAILAGDP